MPGDSGASAVNTRVHTSLPPAHTGLRVHWAPGIPHALYGADTRINPGAIRAAGRERMLEFVSAVLNFAAKERGEVRREQRLPEADLAFPRHTRLHTGSAVVCLTVRKVRVDCTRSTPGSWVSTLVWMRSKSAESRYATRSR